MLMKLNSPLLEEPIIIGSCTQWVIEDVETFARVIRECHQYPEDSTLKLFYDNYKPLKPTELIAVTDIYGYSINTKPILKQIYDEIETQLNEQPEIKSKIDQLSQEITNLIRTELLNHELDLELDEITIQELCISLGVQIRVDTNTVFEKMLDILQIFKYLRNKKLLIFINAATYFTAEELEEIDRFASLLQINVLMIDPRASSAAIPQYILDSDFYMTNRCGRMGDR